MKKVFQQRWLAWCIALVVTGAWPEVVCRADDLSAGSTNYMYRLIANRVVSGAHGAAPGNVPGYGRPLAMLDSVSSEADQDDASRGVWSGWGEGYASARGLDNNRYFDSGGAVFGAERTSDDRVFGLFANLTGSDLTDNSNHVLLDINDRQFGTYLSGGNGFAYFFLAGAIGANSYLQHLNFGSFGYSGWQASTYYEQGLTFDREPWVVQPYVALPYVYARDNGYHDDRHSLRPTIGVRASHPYLTRTGKSMVSQWRALWQCELINYYGARDPLIVGNGLNFAATQRFSFFGNWDLVLDSREVAILLSAGLQYGW